MNDKNRKCFQLSSYDARLADKMYNVRDLAKELPIGWTENRRREYIDWARQVVEQIQGVNADLEQSVLKVLDLS